MVVCPLNRVSILVTDEGAPAAALDQIRAQGVEVLVASQRDLKTLTAA